LPVLVVYDTVTDVEPDGPETGVIEKCPQSPYDPITVDVQDAEEVTVRLFEIVQAEEHAREVIEIELGLALIVGVVGLGIGVGAGGVGAGVGGGVPVGPS